MLLPNDTLSVSPLGAATSPIGGGKGAAAPHPANTNLSLCKEKPISISLFYQSGRKEAMRGLHKMWKDISATMTNRIPHGAGAVGDFAS